MVSISTLYTSLSGMNAQRKILDVTAHNIANEATPGYHRQRVELMPLGVSSMFSVTCRNRCSLVLSASTAAFRSHSSSTRATMWAVATANVRSSSVHWRGGPTCSWHTTPVRAPLWTMDASIMDVMPSGSR